MFYIFIVLLIYAFYHQRKKLFIDKRNLVLYILLSLIGITLGIVHIVNPYMPSIALILEKYMK